MSHCDRFITLDASGLQSKADIAYAFVVEHYDDQRILNSRRPSRAWNSRINIVLAKRARISEVQAGKYIAEARKQHLENISRCQTIDGWD